MPKRIQLSRRLGWRMPPNTRKVTRPGPYGNRFRVGLDGTAAECVEKFRVDLELQLLDKGVVGARVLRKLDAIRGMNLACFCRLGDPCHADVWLDFANRPTLPRPADPALVCEVIDVLLTKRRRQLGTSHVEALKRLVGAQEGVEV